MGKTSNTGPFPFLRLRRALYCQRDASSAVTSAISWPLECSKAIAHSTSSPTPSYAQRDARRPSQPFTGQSCRTESAFSKLVRRLAFQRWKGPSVLC
ncbi:hypothetical protein CMEL01_12256 [Colletotrichum melonis]|uniref:Uncharacterized protein n=1 Tax=Colletotrichum melonis TaxID=1209925 RepID=A0AAI9UWE2_9PEZI|nr:hypothetical protein CMEL01_12256 [Colletotrichum melonis]